MLGTPRIHQREAFLPSDPIGHHCNTRKYKAQTKMKSGSRTQKRNARTGSWNPAGWVGMGRKGAMPEPNDTLSDL